jgi:hypothetical protein
VIEEIKRLPKEERTKVIAFTRQLADQRPLAPEELGQLAKWMAETHDSAEADRLQERIVRAIAKYSIAACSSSLARGLSVRQQYEQADTLCRQLSSAGSPAMMRRSCESLATTPTGPGGNPASPHVFCSAKKRGV